MDTAIESTEKHGFGANGNTIPCVHGLLPATLTRRTLSLAAAVAVPAAAAAAVLAMAVPAQASPAHQAQAGTVSVAIDSMNPQYARPGSTVSVAGTVSNGTTQTKPALVVQLYTSPTPFTTRDQMDGYLSQSGNTPVEAVGDYVVIAASLRPGATVRWHASFNVSSVGITEFGVYPLAALLEDQAGDVLGSDRTLLPFWPGSQRAAGLLRPLQIAWIWPLIDQPHHQACAALTNDDLAASLSPAGRLWALLAAGQAHAAAELTWVIDPALLGDVETMTRPYQVDSRSNCTGAPTEPASKAAATWLSGLRAITQYQPTVTTPYANVDVSALVHAGLKADLTSAYTTGKAVADSVLHGSFEPSIALPPGGTADLRVLTTLASAEHIGTVVLDSSEMPPANSAVFEDEAVTSVRTAAGPMTVLLADHVLTGVLRAGDSDSGVLPPSTEFAVRQRFLAETAMIAAEAPDSNRSIVAAPPDDWSPPAALASELLSETVSTPWLTPTPLGSLVQSSDTDRTLRRQPPPASRASPGELSGGYLSEVSAVGARLDVYQAMFDQPLPSYERSLDEALAATESAAWRGGGMSQGLALTDSLSGYLKSAEKKVKIITAAQVSMGGASGAVPVSIQNGLSGPHQAIRVRVSASVVNSPDQTSQLTVGQIQKPIVVQPQETVNVRLPISSAPQGSTAIRLSLTSANGTPLGFATTSLTVQSTRYGRAILFLIAAAIGVLILPSGYRGVRRWLHADARGRGDAGPPGSVVTGSSSARHPTEAPDDLADARRGVDDA
jgi:Family of unknown function (DUF6049)